MENISATEQMIEIKRNRHKAVMAELQRLEGQKNQLMVEGMELQGAIKVLEEIAESDRINDKINKEETKNPQEKNTDEVKEDTGNGNSI